MRPSLLSAVLGLGLVTLSVSPGKAADPPDEAVQKELKALSGTWKTTGRMSAGKVIPNTNRGDHYLIIEGNKYTEKINDQVIETGTLRIDPTRNPKTLDLVPAGGKAAGAPQIYELDCDELRLVMLIPDLRPSVRKDRPTNLSAPETIGFVLKRVKP
jgi:uncharacterized protein (TIGR03067 family)